MVYKIAVKCLQWSLSFNPNCRILPAFVYHLVLVTRKPNRYGNKQLTTSLKPSPQWRRFRPDMVLSMLCWYWDSSSSFIFLSSSPALSSVLWLWFIRINKDIKLHEVSFSKFITIYEKKFSHLKLLDYCIQTIRFISNHIKFARKTALIQRWDSKFLRCEAFRVVPCVVYVLLNQVNVTGVSVPPANTATCHSKEKVSDLHSITCDYCD